MKTKKLKKRILHLEKSAYSNSTLSELSKKYSVIFYEFNNVKDFNTYLKNNQFEVIFTKLGVYLGKEQINAQKELKIIVTPTTGYNHIDVSYAASKGVKIIGLKNHKRFLSSVKSTAEHTWALILSLSRNLNTVIAKTKETKRWERLPYTADELNGKTLGVIGYGRLGKMVGDYGNVFGMKVLANDIDKNAFKEKPDYIENTSLKNLLKNSDYVILLISWSSENIYFFDDIKFSKMKKGAFFVNSSRGEFIDEDCLLKNLKSEKLAGAALDVLNGDSSWSSDTKISNKLFNYSLKNENIIITPHMGGYGKTSIAKTRNFIVSLFLKEIF
jgi:D-3-phosphoglycerate dehydrogenase